MKNRTQAMRVLRARLHDRFEQEKHDKLTATRRSFIGTGDRSEKVRTYNFPQSRLTDHRIGLSLYDLPSVMEGNLDPLVDALRTHAANDGAEG